MENDVDPDIKLESNAGKRNISYSRELSAVAVLLITVGFLLFWFFTPDVKGSNLVINSQHLHIQNIWVFWIIFLAITVCAALYFIVRTDTDTPRSLAWGGKLVTGIIGVLLIIIFLFKVQKGGLVEFGIYVGVGINFMGFLCLVMSSLVNIMNGDQLERTHIWLPRLAIIVASLIALVYLGNSTFRYIIYNWKTDRFRYSVDYGEGPILDQVMRLSKFQNIYKTDISKLPFTVTNYPPLYQLAQVPFAWIAGPAYWYGRGLSTLSVIAAAIFIALILGVITKDWIAGALSGLLLFSIPYILHWSPYCRVDSFALGLSLGGVFVIARWPNTRKGVIISGLLLTAAVYTRQSFALAAPPAAFFWLIGNRYWKRAFQLVGVVAGIGLGLFLILTLLSRGGFYFNIVTANVNPFHWDTVRNYRNSIWRNMPYIVISSMLFLAGGWTIKNKIWWLAAPYLIGGTISAITVGKAGSNDNYLFEFAAGICLVAGAIISAPGRRLWLLKIPLILVLAWQIKGINQWTLRDYNWLSSRVDNEGPDIQKMLDQVHQAKGPVLADEFMGLVVLDGRQLYFQPFEFKQLVIAKVWNQDPFIKAVFNKQFGMILLYAPAAWDSQHERWTQDQLTAINLNYELVNIYAETWVLVPKP